MGRFPRVTHPSAAAGHQKTDNREQTTDSNRYPSSVIRLLSSEGRPLDLHVLSLPPAFVLSQDQTLMF
jgi:hypothetical protein